MQGIEPTSNRTVMAAEAATIRPGFSSPVCEFTAPEITGAIGENPLVERS